MNFLLQPQLGLSKGTKTACTLLLVAQFVTGASFMEQAQAATAPSTHTVKRANIAQTITGSVKDSDGSALAGVSIRIKGGKGGATTNAEGNFKLDLPTGNETLIISMIGYKTKEVSVSGRSVVNVVLEDNTAAIDEVVVVGYGQQKKLTMTGSVATIDMKAIEDLPVGSLGAALVAQQPGVGVSGGNSRPGTNATITIRNASSILADAGRTTTPLYVIDNVVRSEDDFNTLDQSEVENISILKDASAAIYGARGAYGVIVVTTKRGKAGAPKFSYSTSYGLSDSPMPKMMNGYELATYSNSYNMGSTDPKVFFAQDELDYFKDNSKSWLEQAWKPSYVMRHAFNVSGGNDRATYFAGISYNEQDGNFERINKNKWTFRGSADINVARGVKTGLSISGDLSNKDVYLNKQGGSAQISENEKDYISLLYVAPFKPTYVNVDGIDYPTNLYPLETNPNSVSNFHFFEVQKLNNYKRDKNTGLNINAYLEYDIPFIKGLKAKATFNKNIENGWSKEFGTRYNVYSFKMLGTNSHIFGGALDKKFEVRNSDRILVKPSYSDSYQLNGYLTYSRDFGKHSISALALVEQSETESDAVQSFIDNVIPGGLDYLGYAAGAAATGGPGNGNISETPSESGSLSYVGRLNYSFDNKYLAEFAVRRDASTKFHPDNRWGTFPSLSLGWVVSEESFFKQNVSWMNFFKIRLSGGLTGTDNNVAAFAYRRSYNIFQLGKGAVFGSNTSNRASAINLKTDMANENVKWDSDIKLNAGIETKFLNNRLDFGVDAFFDKYYDLLNSASASVPLTVGANLPAENWLEVHGFGAEVSLGWSNRITKDWSYKVRGFMSWYDNRNVTKDFDKGLKGTYRDGTGLSSDLGFLGYKSLGMLRTQADVDALLATYPTYTVNGTKPVPGMLYYEDVRGKKSATPDADGNYSYAAPDGIITEEDMVYLSSKSSNHYGLGLNLGTTYKKLSIAINIGGSFGGQNILRDREMGWSSSKNDNKYITNLPSYLTDHWTEENTNAKYPAPKYESVNKLSSDFWFKSSTSVAVRNLNVSYELPSKVMKALNISSARLYFVATDPFVIYNDYEHVRSSGDYTAYPVLSSFSMGMNLNL